MCARNTKYVPRKSLKRKVTSLITKQVWEGGLRTETSSISSILSQLKKGKLYDISVLKVIIEDMALLRAEILEKKLKTSGCPLVARKSFGSGRIRRRKDGLRK